MDQVDSIPSRGEFLRAYRRSHFTAEEARTLVDALDDIARRCRLQPEGDQWTRRADTAQAAATRLRAAMRELEGARMRLVNGWDTTEQFPTPAPVSAPGLGAG